MIIAIWVATALGVILWSLVAWGTHALLTLDPNWVGSFGSLVDQLPYAGVLSYWVPGWQAFMHAGLTTTQALLGWVGAAAPTLVGVMWLVGALLMLGGATVLTILVGLMRRRRAGFAYAR